MDHGCLETVLRKILRPDLSAEGECAETDLSFCNVCHGEKNGSSDAHDISKYSIPDPQIIPLGVGLVF